MILAGKVSWLMQIQLVTVGERMPPWVRAGYMEYVKRFPRDCQLILREIAPARRSKTGQAAQWREQEGERILAAVARDDRVLALDAKGKLWNTPQLADALRGWMRTGSRVSLLVGGPDGLSTACLNRADEVWSLSPLTFPHCLVRVIVAEQLYRAWSLLQHHPYHRE